MSWEIVELRDVLEIKYGKDHKHLKNGHIPVYGSGGIMRFADNFLYDKESILIPRKGTLSNLFYINIPFWSVDTIFYTIIKEGNNAKYLYFFLKSIDLTNLNVGSAVPSLSTEVLNKIEVLLPPLETQKRIASILSTYDDLIENNLKRIKLLEETAQNIYKEWFVNFRFPNYEHTEFDAESGLPVGWEHTEIKNFGTVVTGKTPSTSNSNYFGGDIPFIKTPDMHQNIYMDCVEQYLSVDGAESQSNKYLPKNTVIISCIGARAGVVAIISKPSQTNQQINAIISNDVSHNFWLYFSCKELESTIHAIGSSGATMTNVSKGKFENIKLNLPTDKILKEYYKVVECVFEQILILQQQNQKLKEARDILLPRLMNRTIEV